MKCLKKKSTYKDGIFKFDIADVKTKIVTNFYKESPFPNYDVDDNKSTIIKKGNKKAVKDAKTIYIKQYLLWWKVCLKKLI